MLLYQVPFVWLMYTLYFCAKEMRWGKGTISIHKKGIKKTHKVGMFIHTHVAQKSHMRNYCTTKHFIILHAPYAQSIIY